MQTPSLLKPINLRRSIAACLIGTFALRMAAGVMGSMLSLYFDHIDRTVEPLSFVARSLITAVFFLPELVGSPLFGAWSDKYGRKLFILLGPITGAIAVQITALTTLLPLLALTRFLEGLSTASAIPATLGYLSAATSDDESLRGKVVGLFELSTLGGTMGGILIGPLLFQRLENHAFTVNSVFYLVSLAIFFFGMQSMRVRTRTARAARNWRTEFARTGDIFRAALKPITAALTSSRILRFVHAWLAINMVLGVWLNGIVGQLVNSTRHFPG